MHVIVDTVFFAYQYRVVPPNHLFRSNLFGKLHEGFNNVFFTRGKTGFNVLPVRVQRKLEIVMVSCQFIKPFYHTGRVFCPKYYAVNCIGRQAYFADLVHVERVSHQDVTLPYPVEKPIRVVIGYIGPAACAYDHSHLSNTAKNTVLQCIT